MGKTECASTQQTANAGELLDCDIVMAGGVTSGIIYPGAVAMISRRYSFRSIGGTSVGAIAAAGTAAAEYGRKTGKNPKAFNEIAALSKSLGDVAGDGHSRLFHLFTPEPSTIPLLTLLTPLFGGGGWFRQFRRIFGIGLSVWQICLPVGLSLALGVVVSATLFRADSILLSVVAAVMCACFALAVWLLTMFLMLQHRWLPAWRINGYGICTGKQSPKAAQKEGDAGLLGLTPWMHRLVQTLAGRSEDNDPLTFGDLWGAGRAAEKVSPTDQRTIELSMIASDISRNRTAQLPFLETPSPIYAEIDVLERYFPDPIVDWMKRNAGKYEEGVEKSANVIRLPKPQDLPVVFGARLSLSFPVLLSALPLMTPDYAKAKAAGGKVPLRRVWFSDGGLTSNFPIHFFDSPIPTRPTFCLNLVGFESETPSAESADNGDGVESAAKDSEKPISQARAPERSAANRPQEAASGDPKPKDKVWDFIAMNKGNRLSPIPFTAFDSAPGIGLGSFFQTLVNTARFWSDNQMLVAPGMRDRIVNTALREDEGGLNLDMSPKVIADLDLRGRAAGLLVSARFDPREKQDPETGKTNKQFFANHRWVRFRNFMAAFEDLSRRFAWSRRASDEAAMQRGEPLLDEMMARDDLGYPIPDTARSFYRKTTDDFERMARAMAAQTGADESSTFDRPRAFYGERTHDPKGAAPRPKMRLRLRPLVDNDPRSEAAEFPEQGELAKSSS